MRRTCLLSVFLVGCGSAAVQGDTDTDTSSASDSTGEPSTGTQSPSSSTAEVSSGSETSASTSGPSESSTSMGSSGSGFADSSSSSGDPADPSDCEALNEAADPVEVGASTAPTRIHPFLAADGEGVWFTHAEPEPGGSLFDIVVQRLSCDGATWVESQVVSELGSNDIDPSLAVVGDEVHVIWNADDGTGGSGNLQIKHRGFSVEGTLDAAPSTIASAVGGVPISENHTLSAAATMGDAWIVGGVRAHPSAAGFQAFAQPMLGSELGDEAWDGLRADASHLAISVAGGADGSAVVAHAEATETEDFVRLRVLDTEASAGVRPFDGATEITQSPNVVAAAEGGGLVAAVGDFGGELDIIVVHFSDAFELSDPLRLGVAGRIDHNPILVADTNGTFGLASHRNQGGLGNEVVFTTLQWDGEMLSAGEERVLATQSPPYPPTVTALGSERFMVGWAQGGSPNFTTWIQVVDAGDM